MSTNYESKEKLESGVSTSQRFSRGCFLFCHFILLFADVFDLSEFVVLALGSTLVGRRVLREPVLEAFKVTIALVVNAVLGILRVELEGGVALDGKAFDLVGSGIKLGDNQVVDLADGNTELLPDGGERLAVAAPGSVVLDENVLGGVHDNRVEVVASQDLDGAVVVCGFGLGLKVGSEGAGLELINVVLDSVDGDGVESAGEDELSHFLAGGEETDRWGIS